MKKRDPRVTRVSFRSAAINTKQLKNALWLLVRLSQHSLSCLGKDVVLGELHHFFRHVYVTDTGFSSSQVLGSCSQVVDCVLQTVLDQHPIWNVEQKLFDSFIKSAIALDAFASFEMFKSCFCISLLVPSVTLFVAVNPALASITSNAKCCRTHISNVQCDRLTLVSTNLESCAKA